jgi:hypothetical protein
MPTQEERLTIVEKDIAVMKRDIIYKLDDTNTAVTMVRGVVGAIGQDTKVIKSQLKTMDLRLEGIDMRLAGVEERQDVQSQDFRDIKHRLDAHDKRFDTLEQKVDGLNNRFDRLEKLLLDRLPPS